MENKLTHFDSNGNAVIVEVSEKNNYIEAVCIAKVQGKTGEFINEK